MGYMNYKYDGAGSNFSPEDEEIFAKMAQSESSTPYGAAKPEGMDMTSLGVAGATGAAAGGPVGAGVAVGGQFLSQYLNQRAQAERQRQQNAVNIAQEHTKNQSNNLSELLAAYRGALR